MKKLTISDPSLILALQDEIRRSEEARYVHRLHAVLLVAQGQSCISAAKSLGDSPRSVQYWTKSFEKKGFAGLQAQSKSGRPRTLNAEQMHEVGKAIRKSPRDHGLTVNIWDGKTLAAWIKKKFHISLGVRQCQRLFRQLGFRLRKPRPMPFHKNKDEHARTKFKKKSR